MQGSSATKTQSNLVCLGFSRTYCDFFVYYESLKRKIKTKPIYEFRCDERLQTKIDGCRKALILRLGDLVVIQERCLPMDGNSDQTIFTYSEGQNGLVRARHTNLSALASENMWSPPIFSDFLTVLILLQPHMHFSSSTSHHFSRED